LEDREKTKEQLVQEIEELRQLVSELYETEDQLRNAKDDLEQQRDFADIILSTAQAIILIMDTKGRILTFNPYMEKVCGYAGLGEDT
jgi:nitrogen fixation/metabolism regulation signal transduction histidine kinase